MHEGSSPRARAWVGPLAPALLVALSATAAMAAGQCEILKQQYVACAEHGVATQAPKGDFSYIAVCHDRFPYLNVCMSALPDGNGQNDPEGFVYKDCDQMRREGATLEEHEIDHCGSAGVGWRVPRKN